MTKQGGAVMRTLSIKRRHKNGAANSLRVAKPIDGAKPFEVYGFAGSIGSLLAFAVYIFWAYLPESWRHALGITYYPSRYWAVAIPSYLMVMVLFVLVLYMSLNFICTPLPDSLYALCDDHTRPSRILSTSSDGKEFPSIRPYSDIPIIEVNTLLLGPAFEQRLQKTYTRDVRGL
jgi:phosphatidylinositol glycan class P protein